MLNNAIFSVPGLLAIFTFIITYILVIAEEYTKMRKSKPVVLASGIIWILVAIVAQDTQQMDVAEAAVKNNLLEFAELFLFLMVAMTYVNVMRDRKVFEVIRCWLVSRGYTFKQLFWLTGILSFFLSPIVDNLTTGLIMAAVILAVGKENQKFVGLSCINIVIAANAGGVYSPFGDITSLMVWQSQHLQFTDFFYLFIPAAVSYLVPALAMSFYVPNIKPHYKKEHIELVYGGELVIFLFIMTIITAIIFRSYFGLPPALGMMMGLSYLKFFGYYLKVNKHAMLGDVNIAMPVPFDIMRKIERIEWDTLLFFYGIMLSIGGLATFGYLEYLAKFVYTDFGIGFSAAQQATPGNIIIGIISAIIDNIPVMYAVLQMQPDMSVGQWQLITLTTGIGGSILAIGSAAGVALLGQAYGQYTFFKHLKWTPAILLGFFAGVSCHLLINARLF